MKRALSILLLLLPAIIPAAALGLDRAEVDSAAATSLRPDSLHGAFPSLKWQDIKPQIGRLATNLAIGGLSKWLIVDAMKHSIHEMRPDRSDNNSMPSRHSAWAYGLATTATEYLVPYSPFWGVGAHAVAAGVGFERMIDHKHYAGDVLAGAGIGIGTSILSGQITKWIFHSRGSYSFPSSTIGSSALSFSTGASFPLAKTYGRLDLGTALFSQLQYAADINDLWNLNATVMMQTAPLKCEGYYLGVVSHTGFTLGGGLHCPVGDTPLEVSASAGVGMRYAFAPKNISVRRISPYAEADVRLELHLTSSFTVGAQAGYSLSSLALAPEGEPFTSRCVPAFKCSFMTIAHF